MGVCNKWIRIQIPPLPFLRVDSVCFATVLTHLQAFVSDVVREIGFRAEHHWNRTSLPPHTRRRRSGASVSMVLGILVIFFFS
jgi:hypothetical protein